MTRKASRWLDSAQSVRAQLKEATTELIRKQEKIGAMEKQLIRLKIHYEEEDKLINEVSWIL